MTLCLVCGKECKVLGWHIKKHGLTLYQYKINFDFIKKCKKCGKFLCEGNKTGFCVHCLDRSGKNNSFYGKHHTDKTKKLLKIKCAIGSTNKWKDIEYRNKVIRGTSKPRKDSFKTEQSNRITKWYIDNPIQKEIRRDMMSRSWEEGKITANMHGAINRSKLEKQLMSDIIKLCADNVYIKTLKTENNKWLFPDIFIEDLGLIIEFYGDFWHANPAIYNENDIVRSGIVAKEIWIADDERLNRFSNILTEDGRHVSYLVEVVWESDYLTNKKGVLDRLDKLINWEGCAF